MKYIFIILLSVFMILIQYEFDNIGVIDKEIKDKYKEFQGFNGSAEEMVCIGLDEETVRKEINKLNIPELKKNTPEKKRERKLVKKLKQSGYDNDEIQAFGLDSDNDED